MSESEGGWTCVMCPSQGRPHRFSQLLESMVSTSQRSQLVGYCESQLWHHEYDGWVEATKHDPKSRVWMFKGMVPGLIGPVGAANLISDDFRHFDYYGYLPDDCLFSRNGWDDYLDEMFSRFPGRIGVVSPRHTFGHHVDMPFVSREWLDAVGWFSPRNLFHWCWPTAIGALAAAVDRLVISDEKRMWIEHRIESTYNQHLVHQDNSRFREFMQEEFLLALDRLKEAIRRTGD